MGLFDSIGKTASSGFKNLTSDPTKILTGGLVGGNGIKDILFGKKSGDIKGRFERQDPYLAQLSAKAQKQRKKALNLYGTELDNLRAMSPSGLASLAIANQERQAQGQFDSQQRLANQLTAQRGLGRSSFGLGQLMSANQNRNDQIAAIRAQRPMIENQFLQNKLANLGNITQGIGGVLNTVPQRNYIQGARGQRAGGLLDVALAAGGAYLGSKIGAPGAGMEIGRGLGSIARSYA